MMRALCVAIVAVIALSSCGTLPYGHYGLLAVRDPMYSERGKSRVVPELGASVSGQACSNSIFFIDINHAPAQDAVAAAIDPLDRKDIIGLANVDLSRTWFMIPPFYSRACWKVQGVPAVCRPE